MILPNASPNSALVTGLGAARLKATGRVRVVDQKADGPHLVLRVNPRDGLIAWADGATGKEGKGHHHELQRAGARIQNHPRADDGPTYAHGLDGGGRFLPLHAHIGQIVVPRGQGFGDPLHAVGPIVAHGGGLDHDCGLLDGVLHRLHHGLAGVDAALQNYLLAFIAPPAAGEVGPGQVDDGVGAVGQVRPAGRGATVPLLRPHARGQILGLARGAAEQDDFVTICG